MRELLETLAAWEAEGVAVGRAVVVRTFGSSPRAVGAVLLASADGRIAGSVSGGCVEGAVAEEIARARAIGRSWVTRYGIADEVAWEVGLACGGTVDVLVEPTVRAEAVEAARNVAAATGRGGGTAVVTPLPGGEGDPEAGSVRGTTTGDADAGRSGDTDSDAGHAGARDADRTRARVLTVADGRLEGSLGSPADDARLLEEALDALRRGASRTVTIGDRRFFVEVYVPRPRLVVVGADEVARVLIRLAREVGFETVVVDGRRAFATAARFPEVGRLVVGWLDEVADGIDLGAGDAVAVLAHDERYDEPAIVEALRRGCRYVGAIGSRATQADRRARLRAAGVGEADLGRLHGPIGLDLGGRSPAETALAIIAEVVADRYAGTARPLSDPAAGPEEP